MNNDKLAGIILGALGAGALVGIGALVWSYGIAPMIKEHRDLDKLIHADSTVEYNGTIWSAWKRYGESKGINWEVYKKAIVDLNGIKNEDLPGTYKAIVPTDSK